MKTNYIYLIGIISVLLYSSCQHEGREIKIETQQSFDNSVSLIKSEVKKFELDSLTTPFILSLQEYGDGQSEQLVYLNEETGVLYVNDLKTNKILKSITVAGNESSYKRYQGFYYHNRDSIFMIEFKPNITLINDRGEIKRKYLLGKDASNKEERLSYLGLWASTTTPTMLYDGTLYLNSVIVNGPKASRPTQILLDLKTGKSKLGKAMFPKHYDEYDFAGNNYDIYATCVNRRDNLILYSFPAYEKIKINELQKKLVYEKPALTKKIPYFKEYSADEYPDAKSAKSLEYFMTTPTYGGMYYDQYRELYYRLALLPVETKNFNYEERNRPAKQLIVIVLDKEFKHVGESILDKNKYDMFSAFVAKDGLHIQNKVVSDSTLDFTVFQARSKGKFADIASIN